MARADGPVCVCVINMKGGVGKSTLSVLLSRYAYLRKELDVLAIDLDAQANLSQALMNKNYRNFLATGRPSIVDIFNGYIAPQANVKSPRTLDETRICETIYASSNRSLQLIPSRFDFADNLVNAARPDPKNLARYLSKHFSEKDFIIIDCAPTESILTRAAYHASGLVLVPVKPEYFATIGFPLLRDSLDDFRNSHKNHKISVCGIVINNSFYDGGNNGGPEKAEALGDIFVEAAKNNWPVLSPEIPHSRGFPKMMRGNFKHLGNAPQYNTFARNFFKAIGF